MKAGNCSRVWRPVAGVMLVSALTFAVTAQGGPRETGSTRDGGRPKSETARLVTGPSTQIQQAVAGGAGVNFRLTPRKDFPGGSYNSAIYTQASISGNTLTLTGAPGRVFLEVSLDSWGSAVGVGGNNGFLRIWDTTVDTMGFMSGAGTALVQAVEPCAAGAGGTPECNADYGTSTGPTCSSLFCSSAFIIKSRTDGVFVDAPVAPCVNNIWDVGVALNYFGVRDGYDAGADVHCGIPDPGGIRYAGTLALDVLAGSEGTYTIPLRPDVTSAQDDSAPDPIQIPVAGIFPAVINIPTGSCCFGIGTPGAGCINGDTQAECLARPAVAQFEANGACDNPPTDDGCCACLTNADCNDGDACTNDTCNNCVCSNVAVPSWDQLTECCNAATGAQCTPAVSNTCETAACSLPGNRGTCQVTPIADGSACTGDDGGSTPTEGDGNPCTYNDVCTAGACAGTGVNESNIPCVDDAECQAATGLSAPTCVSGLCNCSLTPDLTVDITDSGKADPNCFDSGTAGAKVIARIHAAAATTPINGGQFLITYDPTCLDYNSAVGVAPYVDQVFGPIVNESAGTIFTVVGVGFGVGDGPAGNADMVELSFTKIGNCNSCQICFASNNPQNTYLADNTGQRVPVNPICSKAIVANNVLTLDTPDNSKHNLDCDPVNELANVTWATPTVSDSCGNSTLTCSGEHQNGTVYGQAVAMNGGDLAAGISNFCCTATSDWCDKTAESCWTVEVNDQISLDVTLGLSPTSQAKPGDDLTRCIKFTLYHSAAQTPTYYETEVTFGGVNEFVGKSGDKLKVSLDNNVSCISAWDQLHTLRSCYAVDYNTDCVDGVLHADFRGDPAFGGNWLISGNLDGFKKSVQGSNASLFVIDIGDYVAMVAEWGKDYGTGDTDCSTPGPHGDIDGDGLVGLSDYGFVSMNFLASAKECCGSPTLPAGVEGVTEISVTQARLQGYSDAARADLNGDGMINLDDMNLFGQGVRPEVKNVRGIRKDAGTR